MPRVAIGGDFALELRDLLAEDEPLVVQDAVDGKVHFVTLQLGRDFGTELEVISGLSKGDQVVMNPSDVVEEGASVRVVVSDTAKAPAGKK